MRSAAKGAYAKAQALVRDIVAKHPAIAHMFASGAGLALMRRDSEMTEALLLRLTARGVVALPIHDSYVVAEQSKGDLLESMAEALQKSVGNNVAISKDYPKSLPQYGGPSLAPCLPVSPPWRLLSASSASSSLNNASGIFLAAIRWPFLRRPFLDGRAV